MTHYLHDVPIGRQIYHPDFPGEWHVISQSSLLTTCSLVGSHLTVQFYNRAEVLVFPERP